LSENIHNITKNNIGKGTISKVLLSDIVEAMEMQDDFSSNYYHIPTGEIVFIRDDDFSYADSDDDLNELADWQLESIEKAKDILETEDYIELPTKFDIHEYRMMENFCFTIPGEIGDILYDCIQGSGAFRIFKDNIYRYGIADDWYKYREESYYEIAKGWCEVNEIPSVDDRKTE